jgi:RNA recognition motif-containing protein
MNLYVSNLAPDTSREELLKAFQAHGEVSAISVPREQMKEGRGTGPCRGFGFVSMPHHEQARAALAALDGREVCRSRITVKTLRPVPPRYSR